MSLWYQKKIDEIVTDLKSDQAAGVSAAEALKRLSEYGYNEFAKKEQESIGVKLLNQFRNFLVLILLAASIVSALIGEVTDAAVIFAIVILNAGIGVVQEVRAEKALEALKKMSVAASKVVRGGEIAVVPSRELIPGDIVILEAGDYVPADLRIIASLNLKAEEASLTGESVPVDKGCEEIAGDIPLAERRNMGFMGTLITYGRGRGIVVATAMQTEIGKIADMLQAVKQEATPLQRRLAKFGKRLGLLCLVICLAVFLLGIYKAYQDGALLLDELQAMFMLSVSLAVAAIPEGLPAAVAMVLAFGMQRMAGKNSIMKKLHAVETLGSVSVICTDKTGTLTQNQMTVVKVFANNEMFTASGSGYNPAGQLLKNGQAVDVSAENELGLLLKASALCNDAELRQERDEPEWTVVGDPTEGALVVVAAKAGCDKAALSAKYRQVGEIPFDSDRKMMTTFHEGEGKIVAFSKGAPDILLERCSRLACDGGFRQLSLNDIDAIRRANSEMTMAALRVLGIAVRYFDESTVTTAEDEAEQDLIFVGLAGMIDPPRSEAKTAVRICRQAGIRTVMITGDHPATALAIARELGIADNTAQPVTGGELDKMSPAELHDRVQAANVYSRVSPAHKLAIVQALQTNGYVTAMTGDGVNDAPALKKADIGVAMGITGTEVAKATADMVITDDNFATIVAAVEEGRTIYANIKKFIYFLLSCNSAEVMLILLAILWDWPVPLLPVQLLWVNLVTDGFPAIALGLENKEPDIMSRKPRASSEPLLTAKLCLLMSVQSIAMSLTVLAAFWYGLTVIGGSLDLGRTCAFITLMATQVICAYSARSERFSVFELGFFGNKYLNAGAALSLALILVSAAGPLQAVFKAAPTGPQDWLVVGLLSPVPFVAAELTKFVWRRLKNN